MSSTPPLTSLPALDKITRTSHDPPKLPTKLNQLTMDDNVVKGESPGGARKKGECTEKTTKLRASKMERVKKLWGVLEFADIFPKEIKYHTDLGLSTLSNLRAVATACSDLKKVQREMLAICANGDGTYQEFRFKNSNLLVEKFKSKDQAASEDVGGSITVEPLTIHNNDAKPAPSLNKSGKTSTAAGKRSSLASAEPRLSITPLSSGFSEEFGPDDLVGMSKKKVSFDVGGKEAASISESSAKKSASEPVNKGQGFPNKMAALGKMVAPSKELAHPFSRRKPKPLAEFPKAINANTVAEKPKGPFSTLSTTESTIKKYDENKRKAGESNRRNSENQLSEHNIEKTANPGSIELAKRSGKVEHVEKMVTPGSVELAKRGGKLEHVEKMAAPGSVELAKRGGKLEHVDKLPTSGPVESTNMAKSSAKDSEPVIKSHVSEGPKKPIQANKTIEKLHHVQNQSNEQHNEQYGDEQYGDEQYGAEQYGDDSPLYSPTSPVEEDSHETKVNTRKPIKQVPTTPPNKHKRSADAMLAGSEGKDAAPAQRSVRPRLDATSSRASQDGLHTCDTATSDVRGFIRNVKSLTETAISNIPGLHSRRARDSAAVYFEFLGSIQRAEKRLLDVAGREDE